MKRYNGVANKRVMMKLEESCKLEIQRDVVIIEENSAMSMREILV